MIENAEVHSYLVESINGAATVKALNAENKVFNEYEKQQMKMTWTGWKAARLTIFQSMSTELINQIGTTVLFWVGSFLIIKGAFSIGTLISFNALAAYFTGPLERLVNLQANLQEAFVAANRLGEILELEAEQKEDMQFLTPEHFSGAICFDDVAFRYGTRQYVAVPSQIISPCTNRTQVLKKLLRRQKKRARMSLSVICRIVITPFLENAARPSPEASDSGSPLPEPYWEVPRFSFSTKRRATLTPCPNTRYIGR